MQRFAPHAARRVSSAVCAGLALGACEVLLVAVWAAPLFLSIGEFARYGFLALCATVSLVLLLNRLGAVALGILPRELGRRALSAALVVAALSWPLLGRVFWLLSSGRRVRDLPQRPLSVAVAAALVALALGVLVHRMIVWRYTFTRRLQLTVFAALMLMALIALGLDSFILLRLYPAFHVTLAVLACLAAACAAGFLVLPPRTSGRSVAVALCGVVAGCAAPFLLREAADAPNLSFAIEQAAPLSGKVLRALRPELAAPLQLPAESPLVAARPPALPAHRGVDLRGRDVLLITIDALRADRLRAYGGQAGVTPVLDRLATESVVFERAYTQTPHTSYAIGSLLTGKYLRPVLSLPNASREHSTLPRLLRRYGYRTAGFYPPAVFFVDEERFAELSEDHFGFEYVKEMFAPASDRVEQLREYLDQASKGHRIFAWVHLFEPHEPYETHAGFERGDEPEQRYDSEVSAADAAVAELVRVFRENRPEATVIVSSDHGEEFADHGGYHHGSTLFEEQVRVPLLWSSPGQAVPRVVSAPVELVDIVPTLLASLGVPRDVRMLGDDLSGVLAGGEAPPSLRAFASLEDQQMWTDGRWKAVCESERAGCRLFDLALDPAERRDASAAQPGILERLRGELSALMASLPTVEALEMDGGAGWPEVLARARLGDVSAGPALVPLLGDKRAEVRAEAARAAAQIELREARGVLEMLRVQDPDPEVRAEAALAALMLRDSQLASALPTRVLRDLGAGQAGAGGGDAATDDTVAAQPLLDQVERVFVDAKAQGPTKLELSRRAALALARVDPEKARSVLLALVQDSSASEADRLRALRALGPRRDRATVIALVDLLADVRLRPAIASTLGELGGRLAQDALAQALIEERYPLARAAEAEALIRLQDRRARPLLLRMLGTETGVPGGLLLWNSVGGPFWGKQGLLLDLRRLHASKAEQSAAVPGLANPRGLLAGPWACSDCGCRPLPAAEGGGQALVNLRARQAPRTAARLVLDLDAAGPGEHVIVNDQRFTLHQGEGTVALSLARAARDARTLELSASQGVCLQRLGVVPRSEDVEPPPPEE